MTSVQADFSGGINAFRDDTKLGDSESVFAKNVRSRTGALEGINKPIEYPIDAAHTFATQIANVEPGLNFTNYNVYVLRIISWKSWVYAVVLFSDKTFNQIGNVVIFRLNDIGGKWSVIDFTGSTNYPVNYLEGINVVNSTYSLTSVINECYSLELPASTEFVKRTAAGADPYAEMTYGAIETGDRTEEGLLIVWNQPKLANGFVTTGIYSVAVMILEAQLDVAFQVNNIQTNWTVDERQYVPYTMCNGLAYSDGILYWVGPNGTDIYRSVQGRPLDFVINIKPDGTAGEANLVETTTAYSVSANPITCIRALTTGQIFVATRYDSHFIEPNYDVPIFGEVTFNTSPAFKTGAVNQDSAVELPNDLAIIVPDGGVRSFNAVQQNKWRGQNSVFSLKINNLIGEVTQTGFNTASNLPSNWYLHPASVVFDNYAMFSVKTENGMVVLIYDTLTETWTSSDVYFDSSAIQIRNFAVRDLTTSFELWCQTGNTVYQLFSSAEKFDCELWPRALSTQTPSKKGKHENVFMVFQGGVDETIVRWVEFVDGKRGQTISQKLQITNSGIPYPVVYPVMFTERRILNDIKFNLEGLGNRGWKFQSRIYWPGKAKLLYYQVDVAELATDVGPLQQNSSYRE